jgi:hypothetical protein
MLAFGILRLASLLMECSCMVPLTPAMIVMRGFVFHPFFVCCNLCLTLIIKELKISVEQDRVVTTLNTIKH